MERLQPDSNIQGDCIVTKAFPNREGDPTGVYLGRDSRGLPVYINYWTALEIGMLVGYPPIEVVEQLQLDYDQLKVDYQALEEHIEVLASESVDNRFIELLNQTKDEILEKQERTIRGLRDASKFGTDPSAERADKLTGGKGSSQGA